MKIKIKVIFMIGVLAMGLIGCSSSKSVDYTDFDTEDIAEYVDTEESYDDYEDIYVTSGNTQAVGDAEFDDEPEDNVNNKAVTQDDIIYAITPFFEVIQEQSLNDDYEYAPTYITNILANMKGLDYNHNTPPYFFDERLWVVSGDDNYYKTYFRGLTPISRGALECMLEVRGKTFSNYFPEVEVIATNFPEGTSELNYVRGTDQEIKMILKVTYHTYRDTGYEEEEERAYPQYYFVNMQDAGAKDGKCPWKIAGLFATSYDCVHIEDDGSVYARGWLGARDVPSGYFDMTPLSNEW